MLVVVVVVVVLAFISMTKFLAFLLSLSMRLPLFGRIEILFSVVSIQYPDASEF